MNNDELHENDNEKQPNLIARTWQRLKTKMHGTKIAKRVGALVIAAAVAASLAACDFNTVTPGPDDNVKIVCPVCGENHTKDQHQNQQQQGYSVLLHSVVENEEYQNTVKNLISHMKAESGSSIAAMPSQDIWLTHAHPYGFLESQGINTQAIKNGTNKFCRTTPFVLDETPNRLYLAITVNTDKAFNVVKKDSDQNIVAEGTAHMFTCYLISYDLTEQEMRDYKAMYKQGNIYFNFFNDAISRQKKVTIHSVAYRGDPEQLNSRAILLSVKTGVKDGRFQPTVTYLDFDYSNMGSGYRKIKIKEFLTASHQNYCYFKDTNEPAIYDDDFAPEEKGWGTSSSNTTIKTLEGDWLDAATYYWEMSESLRKDNWYQIDSKWYSSEETKYYDLENTKTK